MTDINALVAGYVRARDKKAELKRELEAKTAKLDEWMEKAEAEIMKHLQALNVTSLKSTSGTAFIKEVTSATVGDRDNFLSYCRENEAWYLMDVKANKTAVKEFIDTKKDLPPGVNWRTHLEVQVRRD